MLTSYSWIRRRTFLGAGAVSAVWTVLTGCGLRSRSRFRFFTEAEARTVEAVCERLIPSDQDPGAKDARVLNFLDIQLTRHLKRHQQKYRAGLAAVEACAREKGGKPFDQLTRDQQCEVLFQIEETSSEFFDLILTHTRQGFYGDPRHGGNYNRVSWRMLRLPFPPIRGREHYDTKAAEL